MKLVKLSLAAVVAAGSFSFANAVALDEAIQNVDLSGYLRYRYESETSKVGNIKGRDAAQRHEYKAYLKLTSDIADNFKAVAVMQYGGTEEGSWKTDSTEFSAQANTQETFKVRDAYLSYNNFDTTINFGRMELGSFWTDDLVGNGIKVLNNSIEGVTLAAYMFDNYNDDGDLYAANEDFLKQLKKVDNTVASVPANLLGRNIYGVAALVDFAPVSAELWVAYMNKVATFYAVDLGFNGGDEDFGYNIHGQYAGNSLKGDFKKLVNGKNGNFYGIEAGVNVAGFDANIGYVGFGDKKKWSMNSIEDNGQLISAGEIVLDNQYKGKVGKTDAIFGTLGYTYDDVRFGVDLVNGKVKVEGEEKTKLFEVTPRVSYKYSDKLVFSSFYAYAKAKKGDAKATFKDIRLEAKYSF